MKRNLNTMGIISFAVLHLLWSVPLYVLFMGRLFGRLLLPFDEIPLSIRASAQALIALIVICLPVGFLLTMIWCRNNWGVFLNILTSFGVYLTLRIMARSPVILWVSAVLWGTVTVGYGVILLAAPIRRTKSRLKILLKRAGQLIFSSRMLASAALALLAAVSLTGAIFRFTAVKPKASYAWTEQVPGDINPWIDQLQGLKAEQWSKLDLQQKADLMQLVMEIETYYLGLEEKPEIVVKAMSPYTLGSYNDIHNTLSISRDHLDFDPPEECIDTVLHEIRHHFVRGVRERRYRLPRYDIPPGRGTVHLRI